MKIDRITMGSALAMIVALSAAACDNPVGDEDHEEAAGLVVEDAQGNPLATVDANRNVTGSVTVAAGQNREIRVFFVDEHGDRITLDGSEFTLRGTSAAAAVATWTKLSESSGRVAGVSAGATVIVFDLMHGGHPDYSAPGIPVTVTP